MSARDLKLSIHQLLEQTEDTETLALVYALLKKLTFFDESGIIGYEPDGTPITDEEFVESVLESSREAKTGKIFTHAEMKTLLGIHV